MKKQELVYVILLFFAAFIWGSTFILVKWTVLELDVYYFLFLRFLLAFIALFSFYPRQFICVDKKTIKSSFILGLLLFASYAAQTEGLRFTTAMNSSLISGLYLLFIPFFSFVLLGHQIRIWAIIGALVSFLGLYFLTQYSYHGINLGDGLTFFSALIYTWHVLFTGRVTKDHSLISLVVWQFFFMTLMSGIIMLGKGAVTFHFSFMSGMTIIITGIFATAFAFIIQTAAQRIIEPTRVGIIFALEGAIGAYFAWAIGGETLSGIAFIGACLMVIGASISELSMFFIFIFRRGKKCTNIS